MNADSTKSGKKVWLWIAISVLVLLALGAGGWYWHESEMKRLAREYDLAAKAEQARQDSIAKAEQQEKARLDSVQRALDQQRVNHIRKAYIQVLNRYQQRYGDEFVSDCGYFLYDITGDSVPELWVNYGTCEADFQLSVYTYTGNKASLIFNTGYGHSCCYRGKDYILIVTAHMFCADWYKLTYEDGKFHMDNIFSEEVEQDYTEPSEPMINPYFCSDHGPLNTQIK